MYISLLIYLTDREENIHTRYSIWSATGARFSRERAAPVMQVTSVWRYNNTKPPKISLEEGAGTPYQRLRGKPQQSWPKLGHWAGPKFVLPPWWGTWMLVRFRGYWLRWISHTRYVKSTSTHHQWPKQSNTCSCVQKKGIKNPREKVPVLK